MEVKNEIKLLAQSTKALFKNFFLVTFESDNSDNLCDSTGRLQLVRFKLHCFPFSPKFPLYPVVPSCVSICVKFESLESVAGFG